MQNEKEKLYNLAYIDKITKLGNYNYFLEKGNFILKDENQNIYVIALDIDKFKSFNKKYGHDIGSKILYQIGRILSSNIKTEKKSIVCRLANDMFGMIIVTDKNIQNVVDKICKDLKKIQINKSEYRVYISIGIYKIQGDKDIIQALDKALIAHNYAKGNYNIQYKIFNNQMEENMIREHNIEIQMEKALENEEFKVYYQPKISTKTNRMVGAEALVRWIKEDEIISPNIFIPVFEKNHFIIELDKYIFEKVCQDIQSWKQVKNEKIPMISVNISKENFYNEEFIKEYEKIAKKYNLKTEEIEIEITENLTMIENISIIKMIKRIKEAGFVISIDDFGTGYSSLNMLQSMPIDIIKIDKTFIDKIDIKNKNNNMVDYIIYIAKKLGLKTVAEGVEAEEQVKYLKEIGCDMLQGYYYSKPLKKKEFEHWGRTKLNKICSKGTDLINKKLNKHKNLKSADNT